MPATREVLEFALTRDPWQQDLLRRVFTQPEVTDDDLDEVLHLLKEHCGCAEGGRELAPAPLTEGHVPHRPPEAPRVVLNSVEEVKNVNRLALGQTFRFATEGITVVYGDNGSGKSGYCRILKRVCRVREEARESVLGNAFEGGPQRPAQAVVRFTAGAGGPLRFSWTDGGPTPAELSRISVFDSKAVPIYADKENRLDFLPHSLDVLPRVGSACKKLAETLDQEIAAVRNRVRVAPPVFAQGTDAAAICGSFREETPEALLPSSDRIRELGTWDNESAQRLAQLEADLAVDPAAMARRCRAKEEALHRLTQDIGEAQRLIVRKPPDTFEKRSRRLEPPGPQLTSWRSRPFGMIRCPGSGRTHGG
jgi:hypothetical protein